MLAPGTKPPPRPPKFTRLSLDMPHADKRRIAIVGAHLGLTMSGLVRQVLGDFVRAKERELGLSKLRGPKPPK